MNRISLIKKYDIPHTIFNVTFMLSKLESLTELLQYPKIRV
jgi:hypothetical protein